MYLTKVCQFCNKAFTFDLSLKQIAEIEAGVKHIQVILPEMPPETRELFISGMCPKCWDETFLDETEESEILEVNSKIFTRFFDMHSGGYAKNGYITIYIEAGMDEAVEIFKKRFGTDPDNVTCLCCGPDYSYYEVTEDQMDDVKSKLVLVLTKENLNGTP